MPEASRRGTVSGVTAVLIVLGIVAFVAFFVLVSAIRVLREYERGVIFRLGRLIAQKGPGLILLIPIIDKMVRVDLRTVTLNIPPQEVITRDNVPASVNAVCYFRVVNANDAIVQVENYLMATSQIAQTTLRAVLGQAELDTLLAERDRLNDELQRIIDEQTEPWGIKVTTVEIKDVEIPQTMQRAMARQAEAEREQRAKIIAAEGEAQAADKLSGSGEESAATRSRSSSGSSRPWRWDPASTSTRSFRSRSTSSSRSSRLPRTSAKTSGSPRSGGTRAADRPTPGLRVVLAPARADRPFSFESSAAHEDARAQCPLCEGREDWTPPETYALRPAGGGGHARLAGAGGPEQVPAARAGRPRRGPEHSRVGAGTPSPDRRPCHRAPRGGRPRAGHVASMSDLDAEQFELAVAGWREACAGACRGGLRAPDGQRGPRGGRVAGAFARPALRARLRAGPDRPRARALHGAQHAHDGGA